jgi:hypothetical protein
MPSPLRGKIQKTPVTQPARLGLNHSGRRLIRSVELSFRRGGRFDDSVESFNHSTEWSNDSAE